MKSRVTAIAVASAFTGFLLASTANAGGFFGEAGVGQSKVDLPSLPGASVDDRGTSYLVGLGYMFTPNVGVEAGWRNLGKVTATASGTVSGTYYGTPFTATGTVSAEAKADGYYLGVIGDLPVRDNFDINGRAGVYFWNIDASIGASGTLTYGGATYSGPVSGSGSEDGHDLYFGLGAMYKFTNYDKNLGLGLNYTRYRLDNSVDKTDIDVWDVRLKYSF